MKLLLLFSTLLFSMFANAVCPESVTLSYSNNPGGYNGKIVFEETVEEEAEGDIKKAMQAIETANWRFFKDQLTLKKTNQPGCEYEGEQAKAHYVESSDSKGKLKIDWTVGTHEQKYNLRTVFNVKFENQYPFTYSYFNGSVFYRGKSCESSPEACLQPSVYLGKAHSYHFPKAPGVNCETTENAKALGVDALLENFSNPDSPLRDDTGYVYDFKKVSDRVKFVEKVNFDPQYRGTYRFPKLSETVESTCTDSDEAYDYEYPCFPSHRLTISCEGEIE